MRDDHPLHDDGHVDLPVVEAVAQAVGHGPLGEQRGPAPADVLEDRRRPHDVQVRVVLAGERGRRQVLRRRARPDGVGGLLAETGERVGDRRRHVVGDGDPLDGPADLRAERADRLPVVRVEARQPIEPIVDRRRLRHDPPEGVRRHAEARRHADALDARELPQVRALAADERDLRPVDLLKVQHHPACSLRRLRRASMGHTRGLETSPPRRDTLDVAGAARTPVAHQGVCEIRGAGPGCRSLRGERPPVRPMGGLMDVVPPGRQPERSRNPRFMQERHSECRYVVVTGRAARTRANSQLSPARRRASASASERSHWRRDLASLTTPRTARPKSTTTAAQKPAADSPNTWTIEVVRYRHHP